MDATLLRLRALIAITGMCGDHVASVRNHRDSAYNASKPMRPWICAKCKLLARTRIRASSYRVGSMCSTSCWVAGS
jgi:hypothetical protein